MTVPGVNVIVAATLSGRDRRHRAASTTRASWSATSVWTRGSASPAAARPATGGSPSRARLRARHALVEACWSAVRQPGPLRAFYQRIRARRGHSGRHRRHAPASSRACSGSCSPARRTTPTRQPSLTRKEAAAARAHRRRPALRPRGPGIWHANEAVRQAERELAAQAEVAYARTVRDYHATQANKAGAGATPGRASSGRQNGKQRGKATVPDPAL